MPQRYIDRRRAVLRSLSVCVLFLLLPGFASAQFHTYTIANDLKGGYQVLAADLNHDGKLDLIAVASGQSDLVWFENPTWTRHTIATGLQGMINAAYDRGRLALASGFSSDPAKSVGTVTLFVPDADPRMPWHGKQIDRLTTSHRLRWANVDGAGKRVLINAPLAGGDAKPPAYDASVPLVLYREPEWKRELVNDQNRGVQHGLFIFDWNGDGRDDMLTASFSGIDLYESRPDRTWARTAIAAGSPAPWPKCGSSDIAVGRLGAERFLAAIEPWHGNELAIYRLRQGTWQRNVIDSSLSAGHTLAAADLDGDARDEIVAGFRGNGGSVLLYHADSSGNWKKAVLDSGIPANSCLIADLNNDQRLDIACIGGSILKWYEAY